MTTPHSNQVDRSPSPWHYNMKKKRETGFTRTRNQQPLTWAFREVGNFRWKQERAKVSCPFLVLLGQIPRISPKTTLIHTDWKSRILHQDWSVDHPKFYFTKDYWSRSFDELVYSPPHCATLLEGPTLDLQMCPGLDADFILFISGYKAEPPPTVPRNSSKQLMYCHNMWTSGHFCGGCQ